VPTQVPTRWLSDVQPVPVLLNRTLSRRWGITL
jgi:hypothetical protein